MLLTTVVLCAQCERATAEWVEVRKHPVSTIYIDPEIARYDKDIFLAWMLADFSPPYKNPLILSSRFQMAYDCQGNRTFMS
ncbi:surface-adhesin E family protein [Azoarcus sp. CIB]|uniref:surface-adhesin E family protein n=1 Tax=Aromatoleum sp. (strain CIB) TaxID=198107 RepID=UPI00067D1CCB